jgi:hypothetical protein
MDFLGLFGSSLADEAIKAMPTIVAEVYSGVSNLLAPAPTSSAEVGLAAIMKKAVPSISAPVFATLKTITGEAVAQYVTTNPGANLNDPKVVGAISDLALLGIQAYAKKNGLDLGGIPPTALSNLVSGGIITFEGGMGLKAIDVTRVGA